MIQKLCGVNDLQGGSDLWVIGRVEVMWNLIDMTINGRLKQ